MHARRAPFGVCIVGSGGIASAHARALSRMPRVRRRWIVSRKQASAQQFARQWDFEQSGDRLEDALADGDVDTVIVASPSEMHAQQAALALGSGKNVIVEIPAATAIDDGERLLGLAERAARRVFVCHTMRSFSGVRELRDRVKRDALDISQVLGFFAIPRRSNEGWLGRRSWIDNLLWHHACHQVDASMWILGVETGEVVGACWGRIHPELGMAMDLSITFRTSTAQLVTNVLTYNSNELVWELRFVTNQGLLTIRDGALLDQSGQVVVPAVSVRDVTRQDQTILDALASGTPCEYDLGQALPAMRMLDLAERFMVASRD